MDKAWQGWMTSRKVLLQDSPPLGLNRCGWIAHGRRRPAVCGGRGGSQEHRGGVAQDYGSQPGMPRRKLRAFVLTQERRPDV